MSYEATILNDAPLGYWPLDDTIGTIFTDISGNGNNLQYTDNSAVTYGSVLPFPNSAGNGTTMHVAHSIDLSVVPGLFSLAHYTLEIWALPAAIRAVYSDLGYPFITIGGVEVDAAPGAGVVLGIGPESDIIHAQISPAYSRKYLSTKRKRNYNPAQFLNSWNYYVATYDGVTISLYINGVLADRSYPRIQYEDVPFALAQYGSGATIGGTNVTGVAGRFDIFVGDLAHAALYNYSLTREQVENHYLSAGGAAAILPGVVGGGATVACGTNVPTPGSFEETIVSFGPVTYFPLNDDPVILKDYGWAGNNITVEHLPTDITSLYPNNFILNSNYGYLKDTNSFLSINKNGLVKGFTDNLSIFTFGIVFYLQPQSADATLFSFGVPENTYQESPAYNNYLEINVRNSTEIEILLGKVYPFGTNYNQFSDGTALAAYAVAPLSGALWGGDHHRINTDQRLDDGGWHTFFITMGAAERNVYVDNIPYGPTTEVVYSISPARPDLAQKASVCAIQPLNISPYNLKIGYGDYLFAGGLNSFCIFDKVLSGTEIATINTALIQALNVYHLSNIRVGGAVAGLQPPAIGTMSRYRQVVLEDIPIGYWPLDEGDIALPAVDWTFHSNFFNPVYPINGAFSNFTPFPNEPSKSFFIIPAEAQTGTVEDILTIVPKLLYNPVLQTFTGILDGLHSGSIEIWLGVMAIGIVPDGTIIDSPIGALKSIGTDLTPGRVITYQQGGNTEIFSAVVFNHVVLVVDYDTDPNNPNLFMYLNANQTNYTTGPLISASMDDVEPVKIQPLLGPKTNNIHVLATSKDGIHTDLNTFGDLEIAHIALYDYALTQDIVTDHYNVGFHSTLPTLRIRARTGQIGSATDHTEIFLGGTGPTTILVDPVNSVQTGHAAAALFRLPTLNAVPVRASGTSMAQTIVLEGLFALPIILMGVSGALDTTQELIGL